MSLSKGGYRLPAHVAVKILEAFVGKSTYRRMPLSVL